MPRFTAIVPKGNKEAVEALQHWFEDQKCIDVHMEEAGDSMKIAYTKPKCRGKLLSLLSAKTIFRKALQKSGWPNMPRQFKAEWFCVMAELDTTALAHEDSSDEGTLTQTPDAAFGFPSQGQDVECPSAIHTESELNPMPAPKEAKQRDLCRFFSTLPDAEVPGPCATDMEPAPSDDRALGDEGESKKQSDATEDNAEGDSSQEETEASKTGDGSRDKQDNCVCVYVDHFRVDLARLLKKEPEQLGRIRKVEGSPPKYSVVDAVVCITGQRSDHA